LNMLNIPIGWEYSRTMFVAVIAIVIYAWLTRISDKLARAGQKTVKIFDAPIFSLLSSN
jgi:lipopolysaccharide export LptBFGC system permease protein LptF